ncbi:hypothetical protein RHMOL_Rhmol06G0128100 [Rhododendron molle]|uniref:Uncharacterized protein n=1 Tax=Rhododendron molle TaxID=49168 RepID=A0ACC0NBN9_RHOML|nr:hypothetical protein RHMOL_Rhmol06G0128100 [Rhododendron molle]
MPKSNGEREREKKKYRRRRRRSRRRIEEEEQQKPPQNGSLSSPVPYFVPDRRERRYSRREPANPSDCNTTTRMDRCFHMD